MSSNKENSAVSRLIRLLDENSFVQIGSGVTARSTDFTVDAEKAPSDGVVCGYGLIGGELVFVYCQDGCVLGGSIGEMHAKKIAAVYDMAQKMRAPVIGLLDSSGLRIGESIDALDGFGSIIAKMSESSGVIPQIAVICGSCGGGLCAIPALADFSFIIKGEGQMFLSSPDAVKGSTKEKCDTASAEFAEKQSGVVDLCADEDRVFSEVRYLISILPENCEGSAHTTDEITDDLNRSCERMEEMKADPRYLISEIADDHQYFEAKASYAPHMMTALVPLGGTTAGVVANAASLLLEDGSYSDPDARLSCAGCEKAADFIHFCDAFRIPIITLTNVDGYRSSMRSQKHLASALAKMASSLSRASVGKINLITGHAFGSAYAFMNSKALGADLTYAWPDAAIAPMDASLAVKILYPDASAAELSEKQKEYTDRQASLAAAERRGLVDVVIDPSSSRKYLISAVDVLLGKQIRDAKRQADR